MSSDATTAIAATSTSCVLLAAGEIIISRTTFIIAITLCIFITSLSILGLAALIYRECIRRRQTKAAKAWGRKSTFDQRISLMRKEVDMSFSRQYNGCLYNEPENPFMGSDSPVELMLPERVWEVHAVPAMPAKVVEKDRRKSKMSLFFDDTVGMWLSRR